MQQKELIFYANRSTPAVVNVGEKFDAPESYGEQTSRRKASEEDMAWMRANPGKWLRVDEKGNKPKDAGYKKTKLKGREHLVKDK